MSVEGSLPVIIREVLGIEVAESESQFVMVMQTVSQFFKEENDFLFKKGVEKERAIAEAKMREEQARAEVKMREEKRSIARAMKADGLPAFQISKFTGLTPGEIEKL